MSRAYKQSHLYSTQPVINTTKIAVSRVAGSLRLISQQKHPFCIGLVILSIFMAIAGVSTANGKSKKQKTDSSSTLQRPIQEPFNSKDYMFHLGEELSTDARSILLFGIDESRGGSIQSHRKAAPAPKSPVDFQRSNTYVFEQVPNKTVVQPQGILLTPDFAKIYFPTAEKQNLIVNPKSALRNAGKPTDSGQPMAPAIEQAPQQAIERPEKALVSPGELFDLDKSSGLTEHRPTYSEQHFKTAANHAGFVVDDIVGVFTLGLGSKRAAQFRENDGKELGYYLAKAGDEGGQAIDNVLNVFYSIGDVILLDSLPNIKNGTYEDNQALLRPFVFSGKAITTGWKTI